MKLFNRFFSRLPENLIISNRVKEIHSGKYNGNEHIISVTVPGTVKRIGSHAFAGCKNLETVILHEEIEAIESNVFEGCTKLREVVYPDSVKEYQGGTFIDTNLEAPVLNASGTILVYCPPSVSGNEWTVFESVKVLGKHAIIDQTNLKVLHLPEGLEKIEYRAIVDCGIRELTIPFSVKEVCKNAIFGCDMLETVTILNPDTIFADGAIRWCKKLENINWAGKIRYDQICHLKGEPFLIQHTEDPANLNHCSDLKFQNLIKRCSVGDSDAMQELSVFFEQWSNKENASPFYVRASNHWRYKAYCKGNKQAADWFNRFFSEHPWERLESIVFDNYCEGEINGTYLNDLGYAFFDPDEGYSIRLCEDYPELVIASAYDSWDSPDDGFGSETDYNWWFLDENMQQIPGTKCVNASFREMSSCGQFSEEEARAIEILKQAKSKL